jgi:hypothetical protein
MLVGGLKSMVFSAKGKEDRGLILSNNKVEVVFNPESGGINQIVNKSVSAKYLKHSSEQLVYVWFLQKGKKSLVYANDDEPFRAVSSGPETFRGIRLNKDGSRSSVEVLHRIEHVDVRCRFTLEDESPLLFCDVEVDNTLDPRCSEDVVGVGFPQLRGICIGERSDDDTLVRPNRFGEKIRDPVGKCGTYSRTLLYGGFASMMWMDIYDESAGLYIASYDRELILTALESTPDCYRGTMSLGMRKYAYVPVGHSWRSSPFVIGVHQGDWHWAADRYREWAESWMVKPNIPEKLKWSDGWYGVHFKAGGEIKFSFKDIRDLFEDAQYLGLNHVQLWGQMVGDGCCYRFYYPDPRLGTVEELKQAISLVKSKGGTIGFYFNIQAFSPSVREYLSARGISIPESEKTPDWMGEFRNYAQTNFDGSATVQYPGREFENDGFRIMCTYSEGWQKYLAHWVVEKYLREYGANFAYIDQTFSPPVSYCFNFAHGHRHHGCSAQGRVETIRRLSNEGRKLSQEFGLCIEGNGDSVGQYCSLHLYTSFSSQTMHPAPEVFAYTFPDYIIIDGFANPPVEWIGRCYYPDMDGEAGLEDLVNRVYLLGFRFDVTPLPPGSRIKRGEPLTEHVRRLIALRKRVKQLQYASRFMDDLGLKCGSEKVVAKVFKDLKGRRVLINLIDYRPEKSRFLIEVDTDLYDLAGEVACRLYGVDGQEAGLKAKLNRGKLLVEIPPFKGKVASIIIESLQ